MDRVKRFQRILLDAGYVATIRRTRGDESTRRAASSQDKSSTA